MVKEKVTIKDLEQFAVGDSVSYTLPNWDAARSAASLASQIKNRANTYGWQFSAPIGPAIEGTMRRTVTITRIS